MLMNSAFLEGHVSKSKILRIFLDGAPKKCDKKKAGRAHACPAFAVGMLTC